MVKMRLKLLAGRGLHSNCSFEHSISGLKSAFTRKEVDNFVPTPNAWWLGRSYAASVASDVPRPEKGRKKVSKQDRRAMVESFVDKYKASNTGKFPSVSDTKKQVGGSFYTIRKILQELQNESTMTSLMRESKKSFRETEIKENPNSVGKDLEASSDWQKSSCAEKILSANDDVKPATLVNHSGSPLRTNLLDDSEEVISSSHKKPDNDNKESGISEHVCTDSHVVKNERDAVSDVQLESSSSSEELKHEDPNCKEQQVHSSPEIDRENIDNRTMDLVQPSTSDSKPWGGRIKSIVDGIINIWRKL
ncbi:uncharacterized protein LOC111783410 [Cucurbita pepo subsp. pepo]|uniref:uncharacterized protein LOC111783410 n=1 Tax=Cucurbita pepo subsp. pepo TaxID=3664 RepID=UPI000C9D8FAE|nr:uncharacterized protein LOC111783410 [Cucurbita pepo subsp. pepo]